MPCRRQCRATPSATKTGEHRAIRAFDFKQIDRRRVGDVRREMSAHADGRDKAGSLQRRIGHIGIWIGLHLALRDRGLADLADCAGGERGARPPALFEK